MATTLCKYLTLSSFLPLSPYFIFFFLSPPLSLLQGYLPVNIDRREETLQRKRSEYLKLIDQYYHMRDDSIHKDTFRQIHIDVPRMNPSIPLFQQSIVQEVSGYGQAFSKWRIYNDSSCI